VASLCQQPDGQSDRITRSRFNSRGPGKYLATCLSSAMLTLSLGTLSQSALAQNTAAAGAQIVTVEASTTASAVTLGGTVVAFREVTLTAQIPGRVEFIAGTEGDAFKKDDILVAIDDDDLLAKRRSAVMLAFSMTGNSCRHRAAVSVAPVVWACPTCLTRCLPSRFPSR
jgi:hypothetical protein